jgi:hypothetical protein
LQCCNVVWINFRLNGGFCMCQKRILTGDRHDQCQGHFTRDVLPCQCDTTAPPFHPRKKNVAIVSRRPCLPQKVLYVLDCHLGRTNG